MSIKKLITKATAFLCISGVVLASNASYVRAYEAHVMNVTANIIDNSVVITPNGGKFCNDGKLRVEMRSSLEEAEIYFTTNGSDPVCGGNGTLYVEPFTLLSAKTVKAVSCYNGRQSRTASQSYDVCSSYCGSSLKVNKVYYNPDAAHQEGTCNNENEWVEIYNSSPSAVNLRNWKICDAEACDFLSTKDLSLPAKGFAMVTYKESTWKYWNVPVGTVKIVLGNAIGNGLNNTADLVMLKDPSGKIADQMNWGTPSQGWANYNAGVWNPALATAGEGKIFGREPNGYDNDKPADWKILSLPSVYVSSLGEAWVVGEVYPIKWTAINANGADGSLKVDLYYSTDEGKIWNLIVKGTENDGSFEWRVPLTAKCGGDARCLNPSEKISIRAIATDSSRNSIFAGKGASDNEFSSSINKNLLTEEEMENFRNMDASGLTFSSPLMFGFRTSAGENKEAQSENGTGNTAEVKQSVMLNKEEEFEIEKTAGEDDESGKSGRMAFSDGALISHKNVPDKEKGRLAVLEGAAQEIGAVSPEADAPIASDGNIVIEFNLNA